jgi:uncharacterized membrane protein
MEKNHKTNQLKKRRIEKTLTWRIVGTIDTMLISWYITGNPVIGISIGGVEVFTKMILYYFHERIWYKSKFGIEKVKYQHRKIL